MREGREFLETWFKRVWGDEDQSAIDELFPSTGKAEGLGQQTLVGPEDFKIFHNSICELLSAIDISIDKYIEEGSWSSALCTMRAVSKENGEAVTISGNVFVRLENGQIQEGYNNFDFMSMWSQLGFLPADCFEQGLNGEKVV